MPVAPRVLLIDDDPSIRALVTIALSDEGYDVRAVHDVHAGVAAPRERAPNVILLDTATSGFREADRQFIAQHRRLPGGRAPVILFTAAANPALRADELGADGLLTKPFDLVKILGLVEALAGAASSGD